MAMSNLRAAAIHFGRIFKCDITPKIGQSSRSTITLGNLRMATFLPPGRMGECDITPEIESLARFAIGEYGKKENTLLEFIKVLEVKYKVVAGSLYYITVEATDAGKKNIYEAGVWHQPWCDFAPMALVEFGQVLYRSSDLGDK